jgi:3-deoxy-D-manno-octulosonic-acid transferase
MIPRPTSPPPHRDLLWLLYRVLLVLGAPVWLPWAVTRLLRGSADERRERLGGGTFLPPSGNPRLWFHGVSVGEVEALAPVIRAVEAQIPDAEIVVSSTTVTGRARLEALYPHLLDRRYTPMDLPWTTRRALRRIQPSALILAESELWPALLFGASRRVPVVVVNGRISDQTLPRARRLRRVYRWMLARLTVVGAQTDEDARRLVSLGLPEPRVRVTGNVKFDRSLPKISDAAQTRLRNDLGVGDAPLLVAGSTFAGEDELLLDALAALREDPELRELRLILVPRHPDRASAVEGLIRAAGLRIWRRSQGIAPPPGSHPDANPDVLLVDTVGELASLYSVARVAVVGRSFRMGGGQNPLEPMAYGIPVVYGPRMENFRTIAALAEEAGAARRCVDDQALIPTLREILTQPDMHQTMAAAGPRVLAAHKGAAARSAQLIEQALEIDP